MTDDENPEVRKSDYHVARIAAMAALVGVLVAILLVDAFDPNYEPSPVIVFALLGTICALVGVEVLDLPDIRR